jgi:DnaJ family protein C protein 3
LLRDAEKRLKMSQRKDYYKILQVSVDANDRDIKASYRRLAKLYHPDKASAAEKKEAEDKFRDVAEAYEVLSNEEKRAAYDRGDDLQEQMQGGWGHHWGHQGWGGGGQQFTFHFNM